MPYQVKFSTGQMVTFDNKPTPADIEEVSNKLGINNPNQEMLERHQQALQNPEYQIEKPRQPGIGQSITQGIVSPFAKTVSTAYNAAKGVIALKDVFKAADAIKRKDYTALNKIVKAAEPTNLNLGYLGEYKPVETTKEAVGVGLQLGSYLVPGSIALKGLPKATSISQGILQGAGKGAITGLATGGMYGTGQGLVEDKDTMGVIESGLGGAAIGGLGGAVIGGTLGGVSAYRQGKPFLPTKTQSDILAMPEKDVYKLNPSERKFWFDNQQSKIKAQSEKINKQIVSDLQKQGEITTKNAEKLQKELAVTSRDKVIELRPKIKKAMGEQSKIYRNLIDEEMIGKEGITVKTNDLKTFVNTKYGNNPAQETAILDKLGLTDKATKPLKKGELPIIREGETTTLGNIYSQLKSLKQDISSGALRGARTFTPEDKLTDDAIHTLTDFMKQQGVDFSAANKFWSNYAPIRNQLVSESKPFLQTGTQTKTFANTLIRVAEGNDVNNENFISQVEKLIGEKITTENKKIIEKLGENEKTAIANKVAAELKLLDNKIAKEGLLGKLGSQKFEIERLARQRGVIKKVIKTLITGGVTIMTAKRAITGSW